MKLYSIALALLSWSLSFSQTEETDKGGISTSFRQDVELEIKLDSAERVYEATTYPLPRKIEVEKQSYQAQDFKLKVAPIEQKIKIFTIKSDELTPLDKYYVRTGFGNYVSPYLDVFAGSGRNDKSVYSVRAKHLSSKNGSVNKKASGNSQNLLDFNGKYNLSEKSALRANLIYERWGYNYYGYHVVPQDTSLFILPTDYSAKQALNFINSGVNYSTQVTDDISFVLGAGVGLTSDKRDAKEREFALNTEIGATFSKQSKFNLSIESFFTKRSDSSAVSRNYIGFKPTYQYRKGIMYVEAGAKVTYDNDTMSDRSKLHVYPLISAEFAIAKPLTVFGGLRGDMIRNTYRSLVRENQFLGADFVLANTNKAIEFYGGIKGALNDKFSYLASVAYQNYKYFNLFINAPAAPMEFVAAYDQDNTTVLNFHSEVNYQKAEKFALSFMMDANAYNLSNFDHAYHRPNLKTALLSKYKFNKKLSVNSDIFYISGIKSLDVLTGNEVKLKPVIDLNLGAEYCFNKKLSAFIELNNLLLRNYQFYQYYPVRGFNMMLGATYSF